MAKTTRAAALGPVLKELNTLLKFLGVFTTFSAIYKILWPSTVLADLHALIAAVTLSLLGFFAWEGWQVLQDKKLRAFFGLQSRKRIIVALPSWKPQEGHTLGKYNYETGQFETRLTRTDPGTSQENIDKVMRVVESQPTFRKLRPRYKLDETLFSVAHKSPRFLHEHEEEEKLEHITIVSYGASSSNHLCRYVLSQPILRNDPYAYHFLSEKNAQTGECDYFLSRQRQSELPDDGLKDRFEEGDGYEFALLIRSTIKRQFPHGRELIATVFVCAGLDVYGSEATLKYLFRHWRDLDRENAGRDFYYLCKVSKETKQLEEFVLHGTLEPSGSRFFFRRVCPEHSDEVHEKALAAKPT